MSEGFGSNKGSRLYTEQPEYEIDKETGLYQVKEWKGAYSMSDEKENEVPNVSPTGKPVVNQTVVIVISVLAAVAGVVAVIPGMPPVAIAIAGGVTAVAAAFGVISPGVRTQPKQ